MVLTLSLKTSFFRTVFLKQTLPVVNFIAMGSHDGVLRSYSGSPPSHYSLKVDSFSFMTENTVDGYEAEEFQAGGHKWRLVIYPSGNKRKNVEGHISLYLEMAGENSLEGDWEIYVDFRLFLLDQKKGKYLVIEDAFTKENCFHREMLRSPGFDKLMALEEFTDDSNGYVVDDTCVFGAEVFVCKERTKDRRERLLRINNATYKQVWKVDNFSKLNAGNYESEPFNAGNQKWKMMLYPKGNDSGVGTHLSLYLALSDLKPTPPVSKIFAEFSLRIIDQKHADHETWTSKYCFTTKCSSWGWPKFISLSTFSMAGKGFLMKDTCILEAEVTVRGIAKVL
ncbi:hypothetical protein M0R45_021265 [Rubus argutus]|uniref:MATH domain-containing protein n=1 Tax=Rubus argutus TaxID=59490 RepID=A0AAW1XD65_RUBAR